MGRTGRGWSQRKKQWFKSGHTVRSSGWNSVSKTNLAKTSLQRLTHQQFDRTFVSDDAVIVPTAARVLNSQLSSPNSSHLLESTGATLKTSGQRILPGRKTVKREQ